VEGEEAVAGLQAQGTLVDVVAPVRIHHGCMPGVPADTRHSPGVLDLLDVCLAEGKAEVPGVPRRSEAVPDYIHPDGGEAPGYILRPDGEAVRARNCSQTSL